MRRWVPISALLAPVALIGGWTLAAAHQPPGYSPYRDTISALAARGATDRAIMTVGLAVLGLCHLATAAGMTSAGRPARTIFAVGGAATLVVAALPQPTPGHVPAATVGFVALAIWPAAAGLPDRRSGWAATGVLTGLLAWLLAELNGALLGLSERMVAGAEALWPLAVVCLLRFRHAPGS